MLHMLFVKDGERDNSKEARERGTQYARLRLELARAAQSQDRLRG